jgi:hypothetical protein
MVEKVRTAFYGKDLRVEIKKYPLNDAGNKIKIVSGGEGHFMPDIGPNSFLDMPTRKKYLLFGPWVYTRTFFALKRAEKCIDFFPEGTVYGPDPEQLKKANLGALANRIGSEANQGTPWYVWVTVLMQILIFFLLLSSGGYIRV